MNFLKASLKRKLVFILFFRCFHLFTLLFKKVLISFSLKSKIKNNVYRLVFNIVVNLQLNPSIISDYIIQAFNIQ